VTRVDFYILPDVDFEARARFACRLTYRAVMDGNKVHVHVDDKAACEDLDELMWAYPDHRFLPHEIAREIPQDLASETQPAAPVTIGCVEPTPSLDQVLINLTRTVPTFFGRFERVAEVVVGQDKKTSRDRYRHYRDRGYPLFHHELATWEDQG
jgi:DNA polymerase-3 subunit chi